MIFIKFLLQRCPERYGSWEGACQDFKRTREQLGGRSARQEPGEGVALVKHLSLVVDMITLR